MGVAVGGGGWARGASGMHVAQPGCFRPQPQGRAVLSALVPPHLALLSVSYCTPCRGARRRRAGGHGAGRGPDGGGGAGRSGGAGGRRGPGGGRPHPRDLLPLPGTIAKTDSTPPLLSCALCVLRLLPAACTCACQSWHGACRPLTPHSSALWSAPSLSSPCPPRRTTCSAAWWGWRTGASSPLRWRGRRAPVGCCHRGRCAAGGQ